MSWMGDAAVMAQELDDYLTDAWEVTRSGLGRRLGGFEVVVERRQHQLVYSLYRSDRKYPAITSDAEEVELWADNLGLPVALPFEEVN